MATTKRKPRVPKVYPEEQKIEQALEKLSDAIGEKEPTDKQKTERKELKAKLGAMKFTRLAKARVAKAIGSIRAVGKLSGAGYVRTPEQVANISKLLNAEVAKVETTLTATKAAKEEISVEI